MRRALREIRLALAVWLVIGTASAYAQPVSDAPGDPAIEAALALRTTTPAEQLRSVLLLVDLGGAEHAKPLVAQLAAAELSGEQMAALVDRFGPAALMRLAHAESLAPVGPALADALLEAAGRAARDPQRLAALTAQLADPSPAARQAAIGGLAAVGADAAVLCLAALADPQQAALHAHLRETLTAMGAPSRGPLLGVLLETNNDRLKAQVIDIVGRRPADGAAALLVGPAFSSEGESRAAAERALVRLVGRMPTGAEAGKLLEREVRGYLAGNRPLRSDYEDQVELWHWDDDTGACTPHKYPAADAGVFLAARLSRDLVVVGPANDSYQRLRLMCQLKADKTRGGMDRPLGRGEDSAYQLATRMGAGEVNRVLAEALDAGHWVAALGAVEVLADIGNEALVEGHGSARAALVRAAEHGDRRLRFAATAAIMKLHPARPYAGSSRVAENLTFFAATRGAQRVVIGTPRVEEGQNLAAMLVPLGMEAEVFVRGKGVVHAAMASADVEFVLLSMTIGRPAVREVVYQLRRDGRTARLPIGLVAPAGSFEAARKLAAQDALTVAFSRPHDDASVAAMIERLRRLAGRNRISPEERQRQALDALTWFADLASGPHAFYELRNRAGVVEQALYIPAVSQHAARALAHVGRPSSQRELVALASEPLVRLADRQAAVAAFRTSVERHGLLMTRDEILQQYEHYNASESADRSTQDVLASILDTIERKSEIQDTPGDGP